MIQSRSRVALLLPTAVVLSVSTSVAYTQPAQHKAAPTQKAFADARKHFQNAEAAKVRGEFDTAVAGYLAAYELIEAPALVYDAAEAYRLAGDEKNALVYYAKYLELDPSGSGASAARTAADRIRAAIADKEATVKRTADDEAKRKADAEAKRKADAQVKPKPDAAAKRKTNNIEGSADMHSSNPPVRPVATVTTTTRAASAPIAPGRGMRIAGVSAGVAGVVAVGAGVVFGLKAQSMSIEASTWVTFDQKRYEQGKSDQHAMFVLTGVGAAALVGGGIFYYVGHRAGQAADAGAVTWMPVVGVSQITFAAAGRF